MELESTKITDSPTRRPKRYPSENWKKLQYWYKERNVFSKVSLTWCILPVYFRHAFGVLPAYFRSTSGNHLLSQRTRSRTQRALTVQMSAMTFTFFACWLPRNILLLIAPFFPKKFYEEYKRTIGDFMFMSGKLKLPWITI